MEPIEIREFRNRIGRAINKLRKEERISAQFLAKVLGVTQPTISRIENGTTSISADKLLFLAKSFNRPLSFFIGEQSPLLHDENSILKAGLVFYGARKLKSNRTINILDHFRTYADFLNTALTEADDSRFAAALATTLYQQAALNKIKPTKIIAALQHEKLTANLKTLIKIINDAEPDIARPSREKEIALKKLSDLNRELQTDVPYSKSIIDSLNPKHLAEFINESLGHG